MADEELGVIYVRLREELARAYSAKTWRSDEIDRLADGIAEIEAEIVRRPGTSIAAHALLPAALRASAGAPPARPAGQAGVE